MSHRSHLLDAVANTVHGPLLVLDSRMAVVLANKPFRDSFMARQDGWEGVALWEVAAAPWTDPEVRAFLTTPLPPNTEVQELEVDYDHSVHEIRSIHINRSRLHLDGEDLWIVSAAERGLEGDSGALKRSEIQLRQAQKMEAVGRLASGVAHDFNNILTAIYSFSRFVMDDMTPSDPSHADMQEILKAAQRAEGLTSQLLAFSRKRTIEPEILDPNQKLVAVHRMLDRLLGEDVELVTHVGRPVGTILMDPTALEQVVVNLGVNARDAMPGGGSLVIETDSVTLDEGYGAAKGAFIPPGDYVTLSIHDTGVGMDAATQQHIFEPFFTTKVAEKGTGLGLSTVYGIVRQAGGFIWVYSEVGKGTTFKLYFPRLDAPASVADGQTPQSTRGGEETILVVEDDEQMRQLCRRALTKLGYDVIVLENGEEALRACEGNDRSIDLLLTDVVMPRMSGKQLAIRLSRVRPDMKLVFMSGYAPNAIVHHGVVDPGVMLLEKPFTPEGIARKVRTVLDSDAYHLRDFGARTLRILLVDDDPDRLVLMKGWLGNHPGLLVAETAQDALEAIKVSTPEAVVCRYEMEGMSGLELHQCVRALNPHLAEYFLFTIDPSDDEPKDGPGLRLVHMPSDADTLRAAVNNVLAGRFDDPDRIFPADIEP